MLTADHIKRFNIPGPRYTSYPTAPEWKDSLDTAHFLKCTATLNDIESTSSIYVHIPFCTSMCYYCGCSVTIRKNKSDVGDEYIDYLEKELKLATQALTRKPSVKQFHLGGGTPNFLSPAQLTRLFKLFQLYFDIDLSSEVAIEVDPRVTTTEHLTTLSELGFNRLSMGIQDFDPIVQKAVNRIQPLESVKALIKTIRSLSFNSLNLDLIYGLPYQSLDGFSETIEQVIKLRPERIALYSYAHVPWLKEHQKLMTEDSMPSPDDKIKLFLMAREALTKAGYKAIAMDHFALAEDEMAKAYDSGTLYRNFMGYTVKPAREYLGFGASAIGFCNGTFIQNVKLLAEYYKALDQGILPLDRGKILSDDDLKRQWVISELMCHFTIEKEEFESRFNCTFDSYFFLELQHLKSCEEDGLLTCQSDRLNVTELGRLFVRNICMVFDVYFNHKPSQKFSKTI